MLDSTARSDGGSAGATVAAGVDDLLHKPDDTAELSTRLRVACRIHRRLEALVAAHAAIERDLVTAARLQPALLPAAPPPGCGLEVASSRFVCA